MTLGKTLDLSDCVMASKNYGNRLIAFGMFYLRLGVSAIIPNILMSSLEFEITRDNNAKSK
ncbi:hypothetical protein DFP80_105228 [Marinomonas rhizomae]|uniref:Uncharacterized protein n=1 Tax=Marinomonas rhizomae TaxID=491948 RepID=A0A366JDH4_9GAMM|nr:hypothetical protein DFP80_105228 [Marinomonas rhizomae]